MQKTVTLIALFAFAACNQQAVNQFLGSGAPDMIGAPPEQLFGPDGMLKSLPIASVTPGEVKAIIQGPDSVVSGDRFVLSGLGSTFGGGTPTFTWSTGNAALIDFCDTAAGPAQPAPLFCAKGSAGQTTITLTASNGSNSKPANLTITVEGGTQVTTRGVSMTETIPGGAITLTGSVISTVGAVKPNKPAKQSARVLTVTDFDGSAVIDAHDVCLISQGFPSGAVTCSDADTPPNWDVLQIDAVGTDVNLDLATFTGGGLRFFQEVRFTAALSTNTITVNNVQRIVADKALTGNASISLTSVAAPLGIVNSAGGVFTKDLTSPSVSLSSYGPILLEGSVKSAVISIVGNTDDAVYVGGDLDASTTSGPIAGTISVSAQGPIYLPRTRKIDATGSAAPSGGAGGGGGAIAIAATSTAGALNLANAQVFADGGSVPSNASAAATGAAAGSIALRTRGSVHLGSQMTTVLSAVGGAGRGVAGDGGPIVIEGCDGTGAASGSAAAFGSFGGNIFTIGGANADPDGINGGTGGAITVNAFQVDVKGDFNSSGGNGVYAASGALGAVASVPGPVAIQAGGADTSSVKVDGSIVARPGRGSGGACLPAAITIGLGAGTGRHELTVTGQLNTSGGYDSQGFVDSDAVSAQFTATPTAALLPGANAAGPIAVTADDGNSTISLKDVLANGGKGEGGGGGACPVSIAQGAGASLELVISGNLAANGGAASKNGTGGAGANIALDGNVAKTLFVRVAKGIAANGGAQVSNSVTTGGSGGAAGSVYLGINVGLGGEDTDIDIGAATTALGGNATLADNSGTGGTGGSIRAVFGNALTKRLKVKTTKLDVTAGGGVTQGGAATTALVAGGSSNGTGIDLSMSGADDAMADVALGDLLGNGGASEVSTDATANGGGAAPIRVALTGFKLNNGSKFAFGKVQANAAIGKSSNATGAVGGSGGTFTFSSTAQLNAEVSFVGVESKGADGTTNGAASGGGSQSYTVPSALNLSLGNLDSSAGTIPTQPSGGSIIHSGPFGLVSVHCSMAKIGTSPACIDGNFSCHASLNLCSE